MSSAGPLQLVEGAQQDAHQAAEAEDACLGRDAEIEDVGFALLEALTDVDEVRVFRHPVCVRLVVGGELSRARRRRWDGRSR